MLLPSHRRLCTSRRPRYNQVGSKQGKPVAEASVTIQTSDGLHPHATRTDANGHFHFALWQTGQYDLRAYSNGMFSEWDKRIMIRSNKTTKITLHLPKASDEKVVVSK